MFKKILSMLTVLVMLTGLLAGCGPQEQPDVTEAATTEPVTEEVEETTAPVVSGPPATVELLGDTPMVVVYDYDLCDAVIKNAQDLTNSITNKAYTYVGYQNDWAENAEEVVHDAREILVGPTNRNASIELINSLEDQTFAVRVTKEQIILAGKDDVATHYAIKYFRENVLNAPNAVAKEGSYMVPEMDYVGQVPQLSLKEMIDAGDDLEILCVPQRPLTFETGSFGSIQGACYHDGYLYATYIDGSEEYGVVVKVDYEKMKTVAISEPLVLGHANDLTYHDGKLYTCSVDANDYTKFSVVDANTLELIEYKVLPGGQGAFGMCYDPAKDVVVTLSNYTGIGIYDDQFENLLKYYNPFATDLMAQGILSDENFIYQIQWEYKDNPLISDQIYIFDWDGKLLATPELFMDCSYTHHESKTLFYVGDELHILIWMWGYNVIDYVVNFVQK